MKIEKESNTWIVLMIILLIVISIIRFCVDKPIEKGPIEIGITAIT